MKFCVDMHLPLGEARELLVLPRHVTIREDPELGLRDEGVFFPHEPDEYTDEYVVRLEGRMATRSGEVPAVATLDFGVGESFFAAVRRAMGLSERDVPVTIESVEDA